MAKTMQRAFGIDLDVADDFGNWLAGLTDGEGCFSASFTHSDGYQSLQLDYRIGLRADDGKMLLEIKQILGIGRLYLRRADRRYPTTIWAVARIADLYHVILPLFEKFPLRSKKANDFKVWKELVEIQYHYSRTVSRALGGRAGTRPLPKEYWDKVFPLVNALKKVRQFAKDQILASQLQQISASLAPPRGYRLEEE